MQSFLAAYQNEIFKISKKKKIVVAMILSLVAVGIAAAAVGIVNNFMGIKVTGSNSFSILVLSVFNYTLIPLFTLFVCIDMFVGERSDKTIKTTLTRPVSRAKVYGAKIAAVGSFILADLLFVMILSQLVGLFIHATSVTFGRVLIAYLSSFLPLMVFALFAILIANVMHGNTSTFLICVLCFLLLCGATVVLGKYDSFFFVTALNWHTLFLGSYFNGAKVLRLLLILLGCSMMFYAGGYYLFEKKAI